MKIIRILAFAIAAASASAVTAQEFDTDQQAQIKELALQAILERPEILREAIAILQQREKQALSANARQTIDNRRDELERDPNAPVLGNPDGDVTVVEFFDYNCPYCKKAVEAIKALLETDDNVRLVYREWPILGEDSIYAARAALAARKQGKYEEMHWALMSAPRVTEASTRRAAKKLGLDMAQLEADMDAPEIAAHIALSMDLARNLGFSGTPSFVVGDETAPGLIPLHQLEAMVAKSREKN